MRNEALSMGPYGLVMRGLARLWPIPRDQRVDPDEYARLAVRNRWVNAIAETLCIAGFIVGVVLPFWVKGTIAAWDVAVQFGLGAALPLLWILVITRLLGPERPAEFWRWLSNRHGLNARQVYGWLYIPSILLGAVGVMKGY